MNWLKRLFQNVTVTERASPKEPSANPEKASPDALKTRYGALYRPAVQLRPAATEGFSHLGGLPMMPPDFEWPMWNGKPQSFLAQLDLREIAAALPSFLPASGHLYFFYDQDQSVWGFDPKDLGGWRVLYSPGEPSTFVQRSAPAGLGEEVIYAPKPVAPVRIELLPDSQNFPRSEFVWERDGDAYAELRAAAFGGHHHHQILGYPSPVQNDDMEEECQLAFNGVYVGNAEGYKDPRVADLKTGAAEWKLLLQLDTDDDCGWMWGDVGTLYFWVRESDARHGDFSKVWMVFQCC